VIIIWSLFIISWKENGIKYKYTVFYLLIIKERKSSEMISDARFPLD